MSALRAIEVAPLIRMGCTNRPSPAIRHGRQIARPQPLYCAFEAMRAAIASARVRGAEYEPKAPDVLRWATTGGASVPSPR